MSLPHRNKAQRLNAAGSAAVLEAQNKNSRVFRPGFQNSLALKSTSRQKPSARLLNQRGLAHLLLDRPLQFARAGREHIRLGLDQEGIEAAAVVDALDRVGGDAQAHVPSERVGN